MLQPIAVKKKSYLIFAGEDFLLRFLLYKKKLSLKSERKGEKKKRQRCFSDQKDQCVIEELLI